MEETKKQDGSGAKVRAFWTSSIVSGKGIGQGEFASLDAVNDHFGAAPSGWPEFVRIEQREGDKWKLVAEIEDGIRGDVA